jgi:hypothetical protein
VPISEKSNCSGIARLNRGSFALTMVSRGFSSRYYCVTGCLKSGSRPAYGASGAKKLPNATIMLGIWDRDITDATLEQLRENAKADLACRTALRRRSVYCGRPADITDYSPTSSTRTRIPSHYAGWTSTHTGAPCSRALPRR